MLSFFVIVNGSLFVNVCVHLLNSVLFETVCKDIGSCVHVATGQSLAL